MNDHIIECPCYRVCALLGVEPQQWCRYRKSDLPPPGMHRFDPKETWCPPGVRSAVLMVSYLVAGRKVDGEDVTRALRDVRRWAQSDKGEATRLLEADAP